MQLNPMSSAYLKAAPKVVTLTNLMDPKSAVFTTVAPGSRICDVAPQGKFPYVCRYQGAWLLRADWITVLEPGDLVEFYPYYGGGGQEGGSDATRIILTIAVMYIAIQFGQPWLANYMNPALAGAVSQVAAAALVNALVPPETGDVARPQTASSNNYNAALAGNQGRIDQPIPVLYGRNKTFPDYASQPYHSYDENDDQMFYGLYCITQGKIRLESLLIDDTTVLNFQQVRYNLLQPGEAPTLVNAAMVTASEVSGIELKDGRFAGPFVAIRAKQRTSRIHIDIGCSRGVAEYDSSGNPTNYTVGWKVEFRAVDDFGFPVTPWEELASETLTLAQTNPVRRSYSYDLPPPAGYDGPLPYRCRPQVRVTRTTPFDDNQRIANNIEWLGLRSELYGGAPLCPTATYLEFQVRADGQMTGLSQRRVAVISRRLLRTWDIDQQAWTAEVETRNAAWALLDKWTNAVYGDGYSGTRCDLDGVARLAAKLDARQDRFDAVFDQTYESAQADQMILQGARSTAFQRNGVMTVTRDEIKPFPVTAFTSRSINENSVSIKYAFATEKTPDGVIVEYWDNRSWDWEDIICPCPGVTTPVQPQRMRLFGVTGFTHAKREGMYQAANSFYRRKFPTFSTELEGVLPAFGSAVIFAPNLRGFGISGEVVAFNPETLLMQVTENLPWQAGKQHYITLVGRNGEPQTFQVTQGPGANYAYLPGAPGFWVSAEEAFEERTKFVFGVTTPYQAVMRVTNVRNGSDGQGTRSNFTISGVIEDNLVHAADNALLPSGDVIQDPVDSDGDDGSGSGTALVPYLTDRVFAYSGNGGEYIRVNITFAETGEAIAEIYRGSSYVREALGLGQWLLGYPYTSAEGALFELRISLLDGLGVNPASWPALNTWHSLGTARMVFGECGGDGGAVGARIKIEIRRAADQRPQAEAIYTFDFSSGFTSTGGAGGDGTGGST